MKKVILLSRVSTGLQDLEQQTAQLVKYAETIGYSRQDFIIIEDKESAVKLSEEERNGLNKLKEAIAHNDVKDVVVYELSRIARVPKILYSVRDFLIEHGVQLHVLNPNFKLLKPDGTIDESANVIFSLFCSMAENEGFLRKQRFERGKAKLATNNKYIGGRLCYGYGVDKDKNYVIIEKERDIVVRIFEEYKTRVIRDIAKDLLFEEAIPAKNLNAASCFVRGILHREAYTGIKADNNGQVARKYSVQFPAIISKETFKEAQEKLKIRRKCVKLNSKHNYLCRNIVFNINNEILRPFASHKSYTFCKAKKYSWETLSIKINLLDDIAFHFAVENKKSHPGKEVAKYKVELREELKSIDKKLSTIAKKVSEENEKILKLEMRYASGKISESTLDLLVGKVQDEIQKYNAENHNLEAEREELTKRLNNLSKSGGSPLLGPLNDLSPEEKEKLVHEEIERIVVIKGEKFCDYTLGLQFFNGNYFILDVNSRNKRVFDESGKEIKYQRSTSN